MEDTHGLHERAKELRCLYAIDAIVSERGHTPVTVFTQILRELPAGWQYPEATGARIEYLGRTYVGPGFTPDGECISEPIRLWDIEVGRILVSLHSDCMSDHNFTFIPDESKLLRRIASRLQEYLEWKQTELLGGGTPPSAMHWAWRQRFAEALADKLDVERFGVSRVFLGGSTARGDARPGSDIDLYIKCHGTEDQQRELSTWIEGWSLCLGEIAFQHTGELFPDGILNVQWLKGDPGVWQLPELQELTLRGTEPGRKTADQDDD